MDKDLISLLYISCGNQNLDRPDFNKSNGFVLYTSDNFHDADEKIKIKRPDLILWDWNGSNIDTVAADIFRLSLSERCGVSQSVIFFVCPEYPKSAMRLKLLQSGCNDFLIAPYTVEEVKVKFIIYQENAHLRQVNLIRETKMQKTFFYLDTFKKELKTTKSELYEERLAVNNALKQVNRMTFERSRLKTEKKELKKCLQDNMDGFFNLLVDLIKIRVEKNRGHGERVAHIAEFVGKELKFDEKKLEDLRKAAMLHEVGLLFVSPKILGKRHKALNGHEKDLFVQYPEKGARLLSLCSKFENCALIIRSLNENADGTGRPQGLKRRYIPQASKILAGSDVFDGLRDDADVTDVQSFLQKLEGFSGIRLDPNIVSLLEKYAVLHMGPDAYSVKGIGIHQLEPGMTLGTAIFTNTGTKLFSVNTLLTKDAIDKIKKYNREYPVDETVYIKV
ncbi:MAG: HD domain-containing protein [Desulfobacula sp.]|nr:HD domain-containing protein [Desulfobacula sp.]